MRYNSYSLFLRQKFGKRVHKVIVDAGFTCPNRDGTVAYGGCIYCNTDSYTPSYPNPNIPVQEQVRHGIEYLKTRHKARKFIVYFQPNTNTYAPVERLEKLYREAIDHPDVVGLSVGTRPDCVEEEKPALLQSKAQILTDIERTLAKRESFQGKQWRGKAVSSRKNTEEIVLTE